MLPKSLIYLILLKLVNKNRTVHTLLILYNVPELTWTDTDPIQSIPSIHPIPSHSIPFHSIPFHSNPIQSNPIQSNPIQSNPIQSNPSHPIHLLHPSHPIQSNPIQSNPSHPIHLLHPSHPIQSNPIQSNPIQAKPSQAKPSQAIPSVWSQHVPVNCFLTPVKWKWLTERNYRNVIALSLSLH